MNETIESWKERTKQFGLILPKGWFGRPFDNLHQLTWYVEREKKLIMELDHQLYLIFTKPVSLKVVGQDLVIRGFKQLVFDRQGYGDMIAHAERYTGGKVVLKQH